MKRFENVTCFLGATHGVGTTMVTQAVAETLAANNVKTLMITCDALTGLTFISTEKYTSLDEYKTQLQNELITVEEIETLLIRNDGYDVLPCSRSFKTRQNYYVEEMELVLDKIAHLYDQVLIDCDSIEHGLTIGAMECASRGYLIITPQEIVVKSAKLLKQEKILPIMPTDTIAVVNKYVENDMVMLLDQINLELKTQAWTIPHSTYGWQAEHDHKTMLSYNTKGYVDAINKIASAVTGKTIEGKRKRFGWRTSK